MTRPPVDSRSDAAESSGLTVVASLATIAILVLVGGLGWWLSARKPLELDAKSIERLPHQLAGWKSEDLPISDVVERMLRADSQVQRRYSNAAGAFVWLYVGYYGTERGGRPEHTPWACYPSAGWVIESSAELPLSDFPGGIGDGRMIEFVVELQGQRRLVHFWYATHRSAALATERALTLDHLVGRFSPSGRADGALVRISTVIDDDAVAVARGRLRKFSGPLVLELAKHWPEAQ